MQGLLRFARQKQSDAASDWHAGRRRHKPAPTLLGAGAGVQERFVPTGCAFETQKEAPTMMTSVRK